MRRHESRDRAARFALLVTVVFAAGCLACVLGCSQGDTGPTGPAGPAGPGVAPAIAFVGTAPALRATGSDTTTLVVRVSDALGNRVVGLMLSFHVLSGPGSLSPAQVVTNGVGEARTTFTSGTVAGFTFVNAETPWGSARVAGIDSLWTDPLSVHGVLLDASPTALIPHWSNDGASLWIEDLLGFRMVRAPASGGSASFIGNYRGGQANPDGSARAVVFDSSDSLSILDAGANVLDGPFYPHPASGYFFGTVIAACWLSDGAHLAVTSNTNRLICTSDLTGRNGDAWEMPVWASQVTAAGAGALVVYGRSDFTAGIFRIDIATHAATQLVQDVTFYSTSGPEISGVTVNRAATWLVYSSRSPSGTTYTPDHDLFQVDPNGGNPNLVLASPYEELYPEWSPDGARLAFCSNRAGGKYNVYLYDGPVVTVARLHGFSRPGAAGTIGPGDRNRKSYLRP